MKKIIFLITLLFFLFFQRSSFAFANSPSDYIVTYTVNKNASSYVNMNVSLTNQEDNSYFSSYTLQLGYSDIKNLKATDSVGSIIATVEEGQKGSSINLKFNDKVVGKGEKLRFNVSFNTSEVAENRGNAWEINIPGISSDNDFNSFNVTVVYPSNIGKPVYVKPNIPGALSKQSGNTLTFTKEDLGTSGISIAFGEYQIYSFNLTYHLKNSNLFPVNTEIAIPPETNYQEIILENINPKPSNIKVDEDGNWLAEYFLKPSESKEIIVKGKAKVNLKPEEEKLSSEDRKKYLEAKSYWESEDKKIKSLAKELDSPYAIYQYVAKNLTYDVNRITLSKTRTGAKEVLDNPKSAVCLEFTDLFIALSRAAGIPAREINGFAYAKGSPSQRPVTLFKDILHAWPEYYDDSSKTWIMVDPTWANTTGGIDYFFDLDVDHLTFVRKGINSSYPVPAGGYKSTEDIEQKDVEVVLGTTFTKTNDFQIVTDFSESNFSAIPVKGKIKIINMGNSIIEKDKIYITSDKITPKSQVIEIDSIPPFSYIEKDISYERLPFLTNTSDIITIRFANKTKKLEVNVSPFSFSNKIILGGIIIVIFITVLSTAAYLSRRIFISRQKRENNLRGESQ